ncbi:MAG: amidohydrolase [SAR324 cluster bacterium]|nr:amidohydrolase [SAR324 cluster bacterium]
MFFKCTHQNSADQSGGNQSRTQTVVRNHKHFTVDIHCHIHVPEADKLLQALSPDDSGRKMIDTNPVTKKINTALQTRILPKLTEPEVRLQDMDAQGIDLQVISTSPFHYNYSYDPGFTRDSSRLVNDRIAEVVATHPKRFVGLGTVPLQNPEMAVAELDRCLDELNFKGVEISTHVNGKDLTRAGLEKFFARCEERNALIFIHPIGTSFVERMDDHYFRNTIGHPLESALAVGHLIFDGYLERYPGLKFCVAHGGGYIPTYSGRFDHPYHLRDDCRQTISKAPSEYLRKFYFDTVVFTEHQLRYMIETWGADHIIMGTDYPYDMAEPDPVGHVDSVQGLSEDDKALVMGLNAAKLLNIEVQVKT